MFIVGRSDHYYPGFGTEDWLLCTPNEADARERFEAETRQDHDPSKYRSSTAFLITIQADGSFSAVRP